MSRPLECSGLAANKILYKGLYERYLSTRNRVGFYSGISTSAFYTFPEPRHAHPPPDSDNEHAQLKRQVYDALRSLLLAHPMLGVTIQDDGPEDAGPKAPRFSRVLKVDLERIVKIVSYAEDQEGPADCGHDQLDTILEEEYARGFQKQLEEGNVLWRVVVVPAVRDEGFWVLWIAHHAIADGTSGLIFQRDLLAHLNSSTSDLRRNASPIVDLTAVFKPLPPSIEEMYLPPLSIGYIAKAVFKEFIYNAQTPDSVWTGPDVFLPAAAGEGLHTLLHTLTLPQPLSRRVLGKCRENGTTLTPFLQTVVAASVVAAAAAAGSANVKKTQIMGVSPISVRRWLGEGLDKHGGMENVIGTYVTGCEDLFTARSLTDVDKEGIWAESRRVGKTISAVIAKKGADSPVGLLKYAGSLERYFLSKVGGDRGFGFEVSNVGVLKCGDSAGHGDGKDSEGHHHGNGLYGIREIRFSQGANVVGPAVVCSVVSTANGPMSLGFSCQEGVFSRQELGLVVSAVGQYLENL
ncbi:alcohol acetyltransferase [Peziza echinospora]|nr:alcohol acetyltransferase [Peziza echinospora]